MDELSLPDIREKIENSEEVVLKNITKDEEYKLVSNFSKRQKDILLAGGLLDYTRETNK